MKMIISLIFTKYYTKHTIYAKPNETKENL